MENTDPKMWRSKNYLGQTIEGRFLTTNGFGKYSITIKNINIFDSVVGKYSTPVEANDIEWQCKKCDQWNHRKKIHCLGCGSGLSLIMKGEKNNV